MTRPLFVGVEIGTEVVRALVIDHAGEVLGRGGERLSGAGAMAHMPRAWWAATTSALKAALGSVDAKAVRALSVVGRSGTILAIDENGAPLGNALMGNEICGDPQILDRIAQIVPAESAARSAWGGLARALQVLPRGPARILHQADWIAGAFSGKMLCDVNSALTTGVDPQTQRWAPWVESVGLSADLLPEVAAPGHLVGAITPERAAEFGLSPDVMVVAGTTLGCARALAAGLHAPGAAMTELAPYLTLRLVSPRMIVAPDYGVYCHRYFGHYLVVGASNSGAHVLSHYFSDDQLAYHLSRMDPKVPTPYEYYPLLRPGERFPIDDPTLEPILAPRPRDDGAFLRGIMTGIARIELLGYQRLHALGGGALKSVTTRGDGAESQAWSGIRQRLLKVRMARPPRHPEAAYGAALLARLGGRVDRQEAATKVGN